MRLPRLRTLSMPGFIQDIFACRRFGYNPGRMWIAACLILWTHLSAAQKGFYRFAVEQDRLSGAPDFSWLNRSLTPADRLFVCGAHFCRVGPDQKPGTRDDERVRLFGTNAVFGGNFPEEADADRIARRLRRLGVNILRLHHMDTSPDRNPEEARSILTTDPYPTLNPVSVRRLRRFLDALKAEGIYVNVNLHVGYEFRPAVDQVPPLPGAERLPTQSKPLHIFYPRMVELQLEFTRRLLTALALKGDPVLAMVEINNESSLVDAFQRGLLERTVLGEYKAELERQWNGFLLAKHRTTDVLRAAWGELPEGQSLEARNVALPARQAPAAVLDDFLTFLAERDADYLRRMRTVVQEVSDRWVPVTGTQVGFGGNLLHLDSHAAMDYLDNHFYVDHYNFPNVRWDARDWRIRDSSSVGGGLAAFLNMAAAREFGRPYTVSEFNQPWPNRQAAEIVPALAAFAALQDWDGIMHFAYTHNRAWDSKVPSGFDLNADWTKYVSFGQAALIYRRGLVREARRIIALPVSSELRLRAAREGKAGAVAPALQAFARYEPELALVHRVGLERRAGATVPMLPKPSPPYQSDTGEMVYDRDARLLVIQAPQVAGVFGFLERRPAQAGAIEVEPAPTARGFVSILLTALDGRPIEKSRRLLLTTPGCTFGTQPGTDPPRMQRLIPYPGATDWYTIEPEPGSARPSGPRSGGVEPVWMERVESYVTLKTAARRLQVYPLDGAGARLHELSGEAVQRLKGGYRIHLQAEGQPPAPWYELVLE